MTNQQGAPEALRPIQRFNNIVGLMNPEARGLYVRYEDHVAALVEAQQPAPSAAVFGLRLVPVEPTDQMVQAAHHIDLSYMPGQEGADRAAIYRAMIAAAPQPAVQQWNDLIGKETHADADGLLVWRDEVDFAIPTPQADSQPAPVLLSDEELCQIEEPHLLNFRIPLGGQYDFARAVEKAVISKMRRAPQGETNAQLDTDSNPSTPGQQRDVAGPVALGQPVGHRSDQAAGHTGAQGDKLLTVAERNIRSFLRSAQFKGEPDREAALNCVDVLWTAARDPADSVPVARFDDPKVQAVYAILCSDVQPPEGEHWEGFAARRIVDALSADSVLEDADPLRGAANWLAEAHGQFGVAVLQGCLMIGYNRAKRLHDAAIAARKQGGT